LNLPTIAGRKTAGRADLKHAVVQKARTRSHGPREIAPKRRVFFLVPGTRRLASRRTNVRCPASPRARGLAFDT
jgi:hypothetical protein